MRGYHPPCRLWMPPEAQSSGKLLVFHEWTAVAGCKLAIIG